MIACLSKTQTNKERGLIKPGPINELNFILIGESVTNKFLNGLDFYFGRYFLKRH